MNSRIELNKDKQIDIDKEKQMNAIKKVIKKYLERPDRDIAKLQEYAKKMNINNRNQILITALTNQLIKL